MKRSVKFCPNCGSVNIKWLNPQMWSIWKCWDCGYQGAVIIEDGELAEEIREKFLENLKRKKPLPIQRNDSHGQIKCLSSVWVPKV